jgi:hypothetical protein
MHLVVIDVAAAGCPTRATDKAAYHADPSKPETHSLQTPMSSGSKKMDYVPKYLSPAANLQIHLTRGDQKVWNTESISYRRNSGT